MFARFVTILCTFAVLMGVHPNQTNAAELGPVDVSGFVGLETRIFTGDPRFSDQQAGPELSVIFQPEFRYRTEDRNHQFSFIPFYRRDSRDEARTHFDVREAYWLWIGDEWEVLTGVNKVFWGVAESQHLVNIINQVDAVEDFDEEDYLGQPMVNVATQQDWGRIDAFVLPGFRERTFPGSDGRLRGPLPVDTDNAQFESDEAEKHVDIALRYSHYFGDWDLGLSYFRGTGREPRLIANSSNTRFIPLYEQINQGGLDLQYTTDAWLWKFEGIIREGQGDTFGAFVGGFEYTFYQIFDQAWDLGIIAEYNHDNRDFEAPFSGQDEDIATGVRLALNDIEDTAILATVGMDTDSSETFLNLEAERRIAQNYDIEIRARIFGDSKADQDAFAFEKDDYIQIRLSRYF